MDIGPKNGKFTWSNKRLGRDNIKQRLDRFLIQDNLISSYNLVISKIIPSVALDHKPIAIKFGEGANLGPIPFLYNPLWANFE